MINCAEALGNADHNLDLSLGNSSSNAAIGGFKPKVNSYSIYMKTQFYSFTACCIEYQ